MNRGLTGAFLFCWLLLCGPPVLSAASQDESFRERFQSTVDKHLGRPYVWGACGLKSFDCSGFVWRVLFESGIPLKRTTARKLYVCLPPAAKDKQWDFGNIVFFDDLRHCGIVIDRSAFYHAIKATGTARAALGPFWRPKVIGVRAAAISHP